MNARNRDLLYLALDYIADTPYKKKPLSPMEIVFRTRRNLRSTSLNRHSTSLNVHSTSANGDSTSLNEDFY